MNRREFLAASAAMAYAPAKPDYVSKRPPLADRKFTSKAVEERLQAVKKQIRNPELAWMFENCFPNTLDTTVFTGTIDGKPDSYVITGDIDAMWLRDSSAQVHPYVPLAKEDPALRTLITGLIHRQARCIALDPYANAFLRSHDSKPLSWSASDNTKHIAGVGERKWEIDSLCYPVRLAYEYWRVTGDKSPFDQDWQRAMTRIPETFREQQRKTGPGPYKFQRMSESATETLVLSGYGHPTRPNGMIHSMFRPSDDACLLPLFVPANLFAVTALRHLADLSSKACGNQRLAETCTALADEVGQATSRFGRLKTDDGEVWAYEVDGYGNQYFMDDANVPSLLGLAYLGCCPPNDPLYQRTRKRVWSSANPYFFRGTAAEGIGGPHEGLRMIWPMSILVRALTSSDPGEIRQSLQWICSTHAGTGFIHESFDQDNPSHFTREWFAWANTLFGELVLKVAAEHPDLLTA